MTSPLIKFVCVTVDWLSAVILGELTADDDVGMTGVPKRLSHAMAFPIAVVIHIHVFMSFALRYVP